jgi:hypothetical protein
VRKTSPGARHAQLRMPILDVRISRPGMRRSRRAMTAPSNLSVQIGKAGSDTRVGVAYFAQRFAATRRPGRLRNQDEDPLAQLMLHLLSIAAPWRGQLRLRSLPASAVQLLGPRTRDGEFGLQLHLMLPMR